MEKHKNVYVALAAAQLEFGSVTKGSVNPAFKSKYADLADVAAVVIPTLARHGVCVVHYISEDRNAMRTEFIHGDSETRVACDVPLLVDRQNMQGMKSATTYAKRIGLESLSGVAPEDDDGNAAAKAPPKYKAPTVALPHDIEPTRPAFVAYCRDQYGGGVGFPQYVADTFVKLWAKKPSKGQVTSAWDKNQDALNWLEAEDKAQHDRVVDAFENRVMELDHNFAGAAE